MSRGRSCSSGSTIPLLGSQRCSASNSLAGVTGLAMKSFMPADSQAFLSSSKALAVRARMGSRARPGRARMARVAS
ncbi:hypothetical protein D3C77_663320 [compost metagenome]